ncbi:MAG: hypothetical protein KKF07_01175 [Candidatus Margulisbacteria bacterium]|nr:hypothetical protein [Candidatus Margulisiibacteriota bacterium]
MSTLKTLKSRNPGNNKLNKHEFKCPSIIARAFLYVDKRKRALDVAEYVLASSLSAVPDRALFLSFEEENENGG